MKKFLFRNRSQLSKGYRPQLRSIMVFEMNDINLIREEMQKNVILVISLEKLRSLNVILYKRFLQQLTAAAKEFNSALVLASRDILLSIPEFIEILE